MRDNFVGSLIGGPAIERPSYRWGCKDGEIYVGMGRIVYAGAVAVRAGSGEWSRGSVFQTGLPFRRESGGLKTPGY